MNRFNFEEVKQKLDQTKREVLVLLSTQAQNYFLSSFKKQGFNGENWQEVQRRIPGTKAYKYPKTKGLQRRTSPILVGAGYKIRGGTLRRAVSMMARTSTIGNGTLKMVVDLPYASAQNKGTKNAGRNHSITIPERRFVGQTQELTDKQSKLISKTVDKIWKAQ
jgi:phage gpG-like protein